LQGLLEVLGLPYVGSDVLASALAMHKRVARVLFEREGLPVAKGLSLARGEGDARAAAERARREVGARLVIKPSAHGSAIGVARIEADAPLEEVTRAIEAVWAIDEYAIVEHFARGREVTCGVLHLDRPQALPPTEILSPRDPFYTYEARYAPGRSLHVCPAKLPPAVTARVQQVAERAHAGLGCRDLSRVDFIVGDGEGPHRGNLGDDTTVTLLEVNTLPGMTATSLYPEAAATHGLPMPRLCDALATRAHTRGPTQRMAPRPLPQ
jgi:D-alanine-D-alanine ligase